MRMTRAALRAQVEQPLIHEDESQSAESSPVGHDQSETAVLKELVNISAQSEAHKTPKKTVLDNVSPNKQSVHFSPSPQTSAAPLTSGPEMVAASVTDVDSKKSEMKDERDKVLPGTPSVSDSFSEPEPEPAPKSTPQSDLLESTAINNEDNVAVAKTPKFDPAVYEQEATSMEEKDDSFVQSIKSRTPGKLSAQSPEAEDSFVEKITSRTPRRTSRIEDSVEAMDALEDALEQFSGELPVLDNLRIESPIKESHNVAPAAPRQSNLKTQLSASATSRSRSTSKSPGKSPARSNATVIRPPVKAPASRPPVVRPSAVRTSTIDARRAVSEKSAPKASDKTSMSFSNSPLKVQPNLKKRSTSGPLSTSRPGFVPARSTKPPTKSSFVLPGEIYAAKLKAEREGNQESTTDTKQFKARPAPKSRPSIAPRENKASQARMSMVPNTGVARSAENIKPSQSVATVNKRVSSLDVAKVRNSSNSSVKRASSIISGASRTSSREPKFAANVPRVASLVTKPTNATPTEPEVPAVHKKVSGKQVFARSKLELKKQEDEKRQKEEAARKARAEAAERGRQASREWAEKKAKLAAVAAAAQKVEAK